MRNYALCLALALLTLVGCRHTEQNEQPAVSADSVAVSQPQEPETLEAGSVRLDSALAFTKYSLPDRYPYKDTVRMFQWDAIRAFIAALENMAAEQPQWCVMQNYRNGHGEAPVVKDFVRDEYKRVADAYGVERWQGIPLYEQSDTLKPVRYGMDGQLTRYLGTAGGMIRLKPVGMDHEWLAPARYVKRIEGDAMFHKLVVVDRNNENITTLERKGRADWTIRSKNPATTGRHKPPHAQPTPLGTFVIQEKKSKMFYYKDGTTTLGGFAPWASRFTNGGYIHGVPTNAPGKKIQEWSWSLGTTPRSHMCVRNASSHAKYIYDWVGEFDTLVLVIE